MHIGGEVIAIFVTHAIGTAYIKVAEWLSCLI